MSHQERRRYFRVDDEVAMTLTPMLEEYGGDNVREAAQDMQEQVLASLEIQLRQTLADIRSKLPEVAHGLDLINQKINLIHNHDAAQQHTPQVKPVSLSACGIAFTWPEAFAVGTRVQLHLFLLPMHHLVKTEAQVVGVEANEDVDDGEPFILRLDFVSMTGMYQEILIQHVVQRQTVHLRRRSGLDATDGAENKSDKGDAS